MTLEDETGYTNVVVWNDLVEEQRRELLGASLLGVDGVVQKEGEVVHLVAHRLVDHYAAARQARDGVAGFSLTSAGFHVPSAPAPHRDRPFRASPPAAMPFR